MARKSATQNEKVDRKLASEVVREKKAAEEEAAKKQMLAAEEKAKAEASTTPIPAIVTPSGGSFVLFACCLLLTFRADHLREDGRIDGETSGIRGVARETRTRQNVDLIYCLSCLIPVHTQPLLTIDVRE